MSGDQQSEFFGVHVLKQPLPPRKVHRTIHKVITFSAAFDPQSILSKSDTLETAVMLPLDDDVQISHDRGDLMNPNRVAGSTVPKRLTAPWPITDSEALWCSVPTLAGATSRVLVTEIHCTYVER